MILRLLLDDPAEAAWNMAVDEALLRLGELPVLRFYAWAPHAVSLGWFQRLEQFADLPANTPVVRRLTGGGAIHHGDEVTFSLCLDAARLPRDVAASYRLLHDGIVEALAGLGVPCTRLDAGAPCGARPDARWCFATAGRDDLVTPRGKLLGSAQRRVRGPRPRVLHHGSLVLRRPALTPFVAAVEDLRAVDDLRTPLCLAMAQRFAGILDLQLQRSALTPAESALAGQLRTSRYADPAFVGLR